MVSTWTGVLVGGTGVLEKRKGVPVHYSMRSSALSEVFWEVIECFVDGQGQLVRDLREGLLVSRAAL